MGIFSNEVKQSYHGLNQTTINAIERSIQNCQSTAVQTQNISQTSAGDIIIGGDISQTQTMSVNLSCVQEAMQNGSMATEISNAIAAEIKAKNKGTLAFLDKGTDAETEVWINNIVNANVTHDSEQVMNQYMAQSQSIDQTTAGRILVGGSILQNQSAKGVAEQIASTTQIQKAVLDIANEVDMKTKTENTGVVPSVVDAISKMFTAMAMAIPLIIGGIILFIIVLIGIPLVVRAVRRPANKEAKKEGGSGGKNETSSCCGNLSILDAIESTGDGSGSN